MNWNEAKIQSFRNFVNANPGFKEEIRTRMKPITETETLEARAMSGSERKGQESVLDILDDMMQMPEKGEGSSFIESPEQKQKE